jgi:flagellar protein FliS
MQLVVAMYETAIKRTQEARACIASGDIWGRARAISKAVMILSELIASLNPEVGRELARNLDRLYRYMQRRLEQAHVLRSEEPLAEVERLLGELLTAWRGVAVLEHTHSSQAPSPTEQAGAGLCVPVPIATYSGEDIACSSGRVALCG